MIKKWGISMLSIIGALLFSLPLSAEDVPVVEASPTPVPTATEVSALSATPEYIGAETCLSCHEDQKGSHANAHAQFFQLKKNIPFEKSCEQCHGPGSLHAEAAGDHANPGFTTIKQFKHLSGAQVSSTCLECHQDSSRMHWKGGGHEGKGMSCTSCHSVHSPKSTGGQLFKATEVETCGQCHGDIKAQLKRNAHMPVMEGKMSCSDCHNPHGSAADKNLASSNANALCQKCHAEKRGPFVWQHPPVMENCINCHSPHGSHNDKMLNARMPLLCQRCHDVTRHPSAPYEGKDILNKNNKVMAQSCLLCHPTIHGTNHPSGRMFTR